MKYLVLSMTSMAMWVTAGPVGLERSGLAAEDPRPTLLLAADAGQDSVFPDVQRPLDISIPRPILGSDLAGPSGSAAYTGWIPPTLLGHGTFSADLTVGFRYDTDANQAAETAAPGLIGPTFPAVVQSSQSDWSLVTTADISHEYAFSSHPQVVWETSAELSDQRFFHVSHNYDLTLLQINSGPRIPVGRIGEAKASVRPFGSLAWIGYGDTTYASLYGGGMSFEARTSRMGISLAGIGRFGNYQNSSFRPLTRPYTGPEWLLNLSSSVLVGSTVVLSPSISWYEASGQSPDFSRAGPAASLSLERDFLLSHRVTELVARSSVQKFTYGGPAPNTSSAVARDDTQWIAGVSLNIPVLQPRDTSDPHRPKVILEYQYLRNDSNYFPFVDHSLTLAIKAAL